VTISWNDPRAASENNQRREKGVLLGLKLKTRRKVPPAAADVTAEESLEELKELARSAGAEVVHASIQAREAPDPATLIGPGKLEELEGLVVAAGADLVIFDHELTPTQLRNLGSRLDCKIVDRTQLILDIFARHARTREGQLQVELAQLNYLLPRLTGRGVAMSRLGGGIGARGPGETQLEMDRRRIRTRISHLDRALERVRAQRARQRGRRAAVPLETVALVGYTNAGKSTLFNRFTGAGVHTSAQMFATLDPTIRSLPLPSARQVLLSDTVGFVRNLPTALIKAFRATLEEVQEADLILMITDAHSPVREEQDHHVLGVLNELGAAGKPRLHVLNKLDLLADSERAALLHMRDAWAVSALTGENLPSLLAAIDSRLTGDPVSRVCFSFPQTAGRALSFLYEHGRILSRQFTDGRVEVEAEAPRSVAEQLRKYTTRRPHPHL
jgi:GTP-binding protein HflX